MDLCGLLARGLVSVLLQHFGELRYALYLVKAQSEGGMTFSFTSQRSKCCIRSRRFKFNKLSEKKKHANDGNCMEIVQKTINSAQSKHKRNKAQT